MRFRKSERIVSQKVIDNLFGGGNSHSMSAYPLRAVYMVTPRSSTTGDASLAKNSQLSTFNSQLLISVPKKRFHHAVDRNRVKRQMREAYRKNKQILLERLPEDRQLALALVWISDQHADSAEIERRMVSLLQRIAEKTANAPAQPQTPTT